MFLKTARGGQSVRARVGGASTPLYFAFAFPLQKILPPKIFGFVFSEPILTRALRARRAAESVVFFVGGQRKPLRKRPCSDTCDSIQLCSNLF